MATRSIITNADRIRQIKTFPSLVKFLRDELSWPIVADDFEDLTYDWEPEELGIDLASAAKIDEVKQLRPLAVDQPWGIFFVKFEPKQLPVVALRRLLNSMVIRKRASSNQSERQAWAMNDLMFISSYGESGEGRHISFAHFSQPEGKNDLPTLKVLGWDNLDTPLHLDLVAAKLAECLSWPADERDIEGWRDTWQSAFSLRHREAITTAKDLAIRLAALARAIRDRISTALAIENERGPLTKLLKAFQSALMHDLEAAGFADMYAQTLAYGLLSARIADPMSSTADDLTAHMKTNPFLKELMQTFLQVGGSKGKAGGPSIDFDELGVSEVVQLLDNANMEAVIRDFGDKKRDEDPVMHFYESFLHEYNQQLKFQRGVFYTPQPVVTCIVRGVHELLQTEFGLTDGLADITTWGEMLKMHPGLKLPPLTDESGDKRTISPEEPFVQILDPATGTATFLVEVIDVIHSTLKSKWKLQRLTEVQQRDKWNDYVPKHLLTRLHAFELMMAPYAIAHMKIGLKLAETGYSFAEETRARIYLTNALETWSKQLQLIGYEALAHEAAAVNEIKQKKRFTVILGNPPYSNFGQLNKNAYTLKLLETYKAGLNEKKINLDDDYIKFIRLSQELVGKAGLGVVGLITNSSYLDGATHRMMRKSLLAHFDAEIKVLNLHGNVRRKEKNPSGSPDENVFDIQQGVSVVFLCKGISQKPERSFQYADLWGTRTSKYEALLNLNAVPFLKLPVCETDLQLFIYQSSDGAAEYRSWISLPALFPNIGQGLQTKRDHFCIAFSKSEISTRLNDLKALSIPALVEKYAVEEETPSWSLRRAVNDVKINPGQIIQFGVRPFDIRWTFYSGQTNGFLARPRTDSTERMLQEGNIALIAKRQSKEDEFSSVWITRVPINEGYFSIDPRGRETLFPLLNKIPTKGRTKHLDFGNDFGNVDQTKIAKPLKEFKDSEVMYFVYAMLFSNAYRRRYAHFLKEDFPRVPLSGNVNLIKKLVKLGQLLAELHLSGRVCLDSSGRFTDIKFSGKHVELALSNVVGASVQSGHPKFTNDNSVQLGDSATISGVPSEAWNYFAGGYQICHKWLKDRVRRKLSREDVETYCHMVDAIMETQLTVRTIDLEIESFGGWPTAFGV